MNEPKAPLTADQMLKKFDSDGHRQQQSTDPARFYLIEEVDKRIAKLEELCRVASRPLAEYNKLLLERAAPEPRVARTYDELCETLRVTCAHEDSFVSELAWDALSRIGELELTIEALHDKDIASRDLAELRSCYTFSGIQAFIEKHWPGFQLSTPGETTEARNIADTGGGCSICKAFPAVNVEGTYWLCGPCVFERIPKQSIDDSVLCQRYADCFCTVNCIRTGKPLVKSTDKGAATPTWHAVPGDVCRNCGEGYAEHIAENDDGVRDACVKTSQNTSEALK